MEEITKKKLQAIACKVRMGVIEGTYCAKSGHPGGSLSAVDYFRIGALIVALTPAVVKRTKYRKMGKKRINVKNMKIFKKN